MPWSLPHWSLPGATVGIPHSESQDEDSPYREAMYFYARYRRGADLQHLRREISVPDKVVKKWVQFNTWKDDREEHEALVYRQRVFEIFEMLVASKTEPDEDPGSEADPEHVYILDQEIERKLRHMRLPVDGLGRPVSITTLGQTLGLYRGRKEGAREFRKRVLFQEFMRERSATSFSTVPEDLPRAVETEESEEEKDERLFLEKQKKRLVRREKRRKMKLESAIGWVKRAEARADRLLELQKRT
jgi:hypothetical protein